MPCSQATNSLACARSDPTGKCRVGTTPISHLTRAEGCAPNWSDAGSGGPSSPLAWPSVEHSSGHRRSASLWPPSTLVPSASSKVLASSGSASSTPQPTEVVSRCSSVQKGDRWCACPKRAWAAVASGHRQERAHQVRASTSCRAAPLRSVQDRVPWRRPPRICRTSSARGHALPCSASEAARRAPRDPRR